MKIRSQFIRGTNDDGHDGNLLELDDGHGRRRHAAGRGRIHSAHLGARRLGSSADVTTKTWIVSGHDPLALPASERAGLAKVN